jgi:Flp pilus assembly pilin Flp
MKAIVNLIAHDEAGATPIEFAFVAVGISMVIIGLLLLGG